ncbi:MAG: hypothetical protein ACYDA1_05035, partial [Vulcanimicrobiaceae bacterium]
MSLRKFQVTSVFLALALVAATPAPPQGRISLSDAVKIAVVKSPVFAAQLAQYRAVRAKYQSAKGALFPNVAVNGTGKRTYGP